MIDVIQLFNFNSHRVRIYIDDGEPWFAVNDIASIINATCYDTSPTFDNRKRFAEVMTLFGVKESEIVGAPTINYESGQPEYLICVSVSGLYRLLLNSEDNQEDNQAESIVVWVTAKVIPAIIKTYAKSKTALNSHTTPPHPKNLEKPAPKRITELMDAHIVRLMQEYYQAQPPKHLNNTTDPEWCNVFEKALRLGYSPNRVTKNLTPLSAFVWHELSGIPTQDIKAQDINQVVQGAVNGRQHSYLMLYKNTPELTEAITSFFNSLT